MTVSMHVLISQLGDAADKCHGSGFEVLQAVRYALQTGEAGRSFRAVLKECNTLLEGFGVECIAEGGANSPSDMYGSDILAEYVNLGDTYTTTILYDYRAQRFYVTSYGDFVERNWKLCGGE